jgi:hypothetical protein
LEAPKHVPMFDSKRLELGSSEQFTE